MAAVVVVAPLGSVELVGVRAALAAGAAPAAALTEAGEGALTSVARAMRLGRSVADEAAAVDTGDSGADLLVRALGVVERTGVGAGAAVEQALRAVRQGTELTRLLRVRTAQARVTATMLTVLPMAVWTLLVAADVGALRFYTTPLGLGVAGASVALLTLGRWWSWRLVRRASQAGARSDPLAPEAARLHRGRALAGGLPALGAVWLLAGPAAGLVAGALVGGLLGRPGVRPGVDAGAGGATETVELVAVALAAGLAPLEAVETVAALAPPPARGPLRDAERRLRGGWGLRTAFEGSGLDDLGRVLAVANRWGAPAAQSLRELADDLRATRRAEAEEAAERVQVALVFPTTLLTLPAFVLGVVPPLLWTAFTGVSPT